MIFDIRDKTGILTYVFMAFPKGMTSIHHTAMPRQPWSMLMGQGPFNHTSTI